MKIASAFFISAIVMFLGTYFIVGYSWELSLLLAFLLAISTILYFPLKRMK